MAVEFKASMTKAELLKIAAENGVTADDSMTKRRFSTRWKPTTPQKPPEQAQSRPQMERAGTGRKPPRMAQRAHRTARRTPERVKIPQALKTAQRARRRSRRGTTCSFTPDRPFRKADCGKTPCSTDGFRT